MRLHKVIKGYWMVLDSISDAPWWNVSFPDFPAVFSAGETLDEALAMAKEALDESVKAIIADRELRLPVPTDRPRRKPRGCELAFIPLDASIAMAAWLVQFRRERGWTQSRMAAQLGIRQQSYARYETPGAINLTVDRLQAVLEKLDLTLDLSVQRKVV